MDPTIVLQEPIDQRAYWRERKSIHYPLIRRRIEIRNAMLLRPFLSPAARGEAETQRRREWKRVAPRTRGDGPRSGPPRHAHGGCSSLAQGWTPGVVGGQWMNPLLPAHAALWASAACLVWSPARDPGGDAAIRQVHSKKRIFAV
ncbi:DUF6545 domain-containing protein [Streptomyces xanthochromogenes]